MKKLINAAVSMLALLLLAPFHVSANEVTSVGTNQPGSIFYSSGTAIAEVMQGVDVQMRVQPYAGSGPLMALVNQGVLDFAIVNAFEMSRAIDGNSPFSQEHPNLRVASSLFKSYVGFLVPEDSNIVELKDIAGHSLASGYTAAPIIDLMRLAILANAGLSDDDIATIPVPNTLRGGDLISSGRADVGFLSAGSGKVAELNATMSGVRFLSLYDDEEAVSALQNVMPQGTPAPLSRDIMPPGVEKDTNLLSYDVVLVTNNRVSEELVYKVVAALAENGEKLASIVPYFKGIDIEQMSGVPGLPYHNGALNFFNK